jgi:hypothetical protein
MGSKDRQHLTMLLRTGGRARTLLSARFSQALQVASGRPLASKLDGRDKPGQDEGHWGSEARRSALPLSAASP